MAFLARQLGNVLRKSLQVQSSRNLHWAMPLLGNQHPDASRVWKVGKLNHVAIAVPDLDQATAFYRDILGAKVSEAHPQPDHGVYTVFVELGDTKIELLYPMGEKSPIAGFLEKNKAGGMHHICIEVNDINTALADLSKHNIRSLGKEPRIGAHGKPVMFLHPKDCGGVLVELEEEKNA